MDAFEFGFRDELDKIASVKGTVKKVGLSAAALAGLLSPAKGDDLNLKAKPASWETFERHAPKASEDWGPFEKKMKAKFESLTPGGKHQPSGIKGYVSAKGDFSRPIPPSDRWDEKPRGLITKDSPIKGKALSSIPPKKLSPWMTRVRGK